MYRKCVLTVPLTIVNQDLPWNLKEAIIVIGGTMYTKCVLTVPLTIVHQDLPWNLKEVIIVIG